VSTCPVDDKGNRQGADTASGKTEASDRGGVARSSEAGAVKAGERRGGIIDGEARSQPPRREELGTSTQAFAIPKRAVDEAWPRVKAHRGAAGIAGESLAALEQKLRGNLYRIWNRLGSGSYLPPPVKAVGLPKAGGGIRPRGIPRVGDRGAQTGAKRALEPQREPHFARDSYG